MSRQLHLLLATARPRRSTGAHVLAPSTTTVRVLPTDLDLYLHVNNGTYLQMMDVARSNYIADIGGVARLRDKRWYPVVAASTMTYRRSLRLGERVDITTRVLGWDERVVYLEQLFSRRGEPCARGLVAGRFLTRGTGERVPAPRVVAHLAGGGLSSPEVPADVLTWARVLDVAHRGAAPG